MIDWLKKRKMIQRWKFIFWSLTCIFFGCGIAIMNFELSKIIFGSFFVLFTGWKILFDNDFL